MKTINLQGKEYAQVKDRIAEAHKGNPKMSISTHYDILKQDEKSISFIFKATVTIEKWEYTWHSCQLVTTRKDFEKWETIAVWRALAFAWYLSDGEIASFEEVENMDMGDIHIDEATEGFTPHTDK